MTASHEGYAAENNSSKARAPVEWRAATGTESEIASRRRQELESGALFIKFAYLPICLFALKSEELLLRRHDWVTPNVPYSPLVTGGNYPIVLLGLRMHAPARAPLDAAPWPSPKIHRSV